MTTQSPGPFDSRLAKVLDQGTRAEPCPAVEVLAAYVDHDLDADTLAACEAHVSTCPRCQAIVATVSLDEDVATPMGTDIIRESTPAAGPTVVAFTRRRLLRVAAPIGLAASVFLAVWIARTPPPPETSAGKVTLEDRVLPAAPPPAEPDEVPLRDVETAPQHAAPADRSNQGASPALRMQQVPSSPASDPAEAAERLATLPAAPEATAGALAKSARTAPAADQTRANEAASMVYSPPTLVVVSPSGQVRWTAANGVISRVGAPAAAARTETGDDLRAGAAWSDTIAWMVGARGAVWRTTDGASWTRVPFPTAATLVAIEVAGPDVATVTTERSERLTTTDGGRTWK